MEGAEAAKTRVIFGEYDMVFSKLRFNFGAV